MLRATALMLLAALLAGSSLWLTWGEKEVTYEDCFLDPHQGRLCETVTVFARYDPKALNGRITSTLAADGGDVETVRDVFWHPYDEPAGASVDAWWQSPVLAAARPLLLAGLVAGPVAAGAAWSLRAARPRLAPFAALAGAVVLGLGPAAALGGMLLHAATWTASSVEPLRASAGSLFLFAAGFTGLVGGLRLHNLLHDAAHGRNESPLVPAARLYGFEEAQDAEDTEEGADGAADPETEPSPDPSSGPTPDRAWTWPPGATLALAAVLLLLLPLGVPLASKDITVRDCVDHPERGAVCSEESYRVAYFAAHADAWTVHRSDDALPRITLEPVATDGGDGSLGYYGAWQDAFGGPAWMGLGALLLLPGVGAFTAWGVRAGRRLDAHRTGLAAAGLLAAAFLLTVAAVALQAGTWEGAPAARSEPRLGAWSGLVGLLLLGLWALRLPRPEATATATSPAGSEAP